MDRRRVVADWRDRDEVLASVHGDLAVVCPSRDMRCGHGNKASRWPEAFSAREFARIIGGRYWVGVLLVPKMLVKGDDPWLLH